MEHKGSSFPYDFAVKAAGVLLVAGMIWGNTQMKLDALEKSVASIPNQQQALQQSLDGLKEEVQRLRVELVETRTEFKAYKERR